MKLLRYFLFLLNLIPIMYFINSQVIDKYYELKGKKESWKSVKLDIYSIKYSLNYIVNDDRDNDEPYYVLPNNPEKYTWNLYANYSYKYNGVSYNYNNKIIFLTFNSSVLTKAVKEELEDRLKGAKYINAYIDPKKPDYCVLVNDFSLINIFSVVMIAILFLFSSYMITISLPSKKEALYNRIVVVS